MWGYATVLRQTVQAASALYTMPNYSQSTHGQTSTQRQTFTDRQTDTLITILRSPIGGGVITRDDSSNGAIELSWRRQRGEEKAAATVC